jgi:hypothetical protein
MAKTPNPHIPGKDTHIFYSVLPRLLNIYCPSYTDSPYQRRYLYTRDAVAGLKGAKIIPDDPAYQKLMAEGKPQDIVKSVVIVNE